MDRVLTIVEEILDPGTTASWKAFFVSNHDSFQNFSLSQEITHEQHIVYSDFIALIEDSMQKVCTKFDYSVEEFKDFFRDNPSG